MEKDIKLSNIKGLLIFLVVFGHLLSPYQDKFYGLYLWIYTFHMPLFILLSGYFAKRVSLKKVTNLVLLYLIFQPIYRYFIVLIGVSHRLHIKLDHPYYQLWYLTSMIAWSLILMIINNTVINKVNKVLLVSICFLIGSASRVYAGTLSAIIGSYYSDLSPHTLSYQKTLYFLPFFVLGACISKESMHKLYHSLKAGKLAALMVTLAVFVYYNFGVIKNLEKAFKGSSELQDLTGTVYQKFFFIFVAYFLALLLCYVYLNAMTSKKCIFTKWGDRSLSIFIFHMFFVRPLEEVKFLGGLNQIVLIVIILLLALTITIVLSTELFMKYTFYMLNPLKTIELITKNFNKFRRQSVNT